jgi:hypothetical protein
MRSTLALFTLLPALALAQADGGAAAPAKPAEPPPPADEINRVLEYYFYGKDRGPALTALKACLKVDSNKDSPTKFECLEAVSGPVKKGQTVNLWVTFFVPEGGNYDDVRMVFIHEKEIRSTIDLKLDKSMRSRTWRPQGMTKAGKWTLKVMRGDKELGSTQVTVTE